jgi:S1-C subfamily serine protease
MAVGSPHGFGITVTAGIIGAVPRAKPARAVDDLLQTDAATFPAGAGGALVNGHGEVIGLISVLTSDPFGITFALPGNRVRDVAARLSRDGAVHRGSIQVQFQPVTPGLARALRLSEPGGLLITHVSPRGAAAASGLRSGDVVSRLDGQRLSSTYDVERLLRDSAPGQVVEIAYWRRGQARVSRVTLTRETDEAPERPVASRSAALLRFEVRALTPEMGVVVSHVRGPVPAGEPGVRAGDIIREIDQQPVRTIEDFNRLMEGVRPGGWLAMLVQRGRSALYLAVEARRSERSAMPSVR